MPGRNVTVVSAGAVVGLRSSTVCAPSGRASKEKRPVPSVTLRDAPWSTITATPATGTRSPLRSTVPDSGTVGARGAVGAARGAVKGSTGATGAGGGLNRK